MEVNSFVADLIKNISVDDPRELELEAKKYNLDSWINLHKTKATGMGAMISVIHIPIIGKGFDVAYLGRIIGKLCFGIGHIKNKPVDYNSDLEGILAILTEIAIPISRKELKEKFKKNFYLEIDNEYKKYLEEHNNRSILKKLLDIILFRFRPLSLEDFEKKLFQDYLDKIIIKNKLIMDHCENNINKFIRDTVFTFRLTKNLTGSLSKKVGAKIGMKMGTKVGSKILSKAGSKLGAKMVGKISTKYIPGIGPISSAAINLWIMDGFSQAAIKYYDADYIKIKSDISKEVFEDINLNAIINNIL
jgi:hypothetical protein